MRRTPALLALALALASAFAPGGARARHYCSSALVVFSGVEPVNPVNTNTTMCLVVPDQHDWDGRIINPASNYVRVRYTADLGAEVATVEAFLDGPPFGFERTKLTLARVQSVTGSWVYDSERLPVPPTASGCLRTWIERPVTDATAFHTIDAACPS